MPHKEEMAASSHCPLEDIRRIRSAEVKSTSGRAELGEAADSNSITEGR